jgi:hypothetical protein
MVSANYKLSLDSLRRELTGIDAWILVIDTKGINVWCAAGKGTFGTMELMEKIARFELEKVLSHRTLILPQLGAPGVSALLVRKMAGFRVVYGPVRARHIPAFLAAGMKKTDAMRRVEFRLSDRLAVAPIEIVRSLPVMPVMLVLAGLYALPFGDGYLGRLLGMFIPLAGSLLVGTAVFPAVLPFLPFHAFSLKGAVLGVLWAVGAALISGSTLVGTVVLALLTVPIVSYIAMNFTGSSTFTCQTGAELEVRRGLIPMAASLVVGAALALTGRFVGF